MPSSASSSGRSADRVRSEPLAVTAAAGSPPERPGVNGRRAGRRQQFGWTALGLPAVAWIGIFFLYPVIAILTRSFTEFSEPTGAGFDNYTWFFETDANVTVLTRTIWVSTYVTVFCLLIGYPYAYMMTMASKGVRLAMLTAVILPVMTSPLVRTYAWLGLMSRNGPLVALMDKAGVDEPQLLGTVTGVAVSMVHISLPMMVLPLYTAMLRIDRRLLRAAESLGATPRRAFWRVYLPLSVPGIIAGSILVFVLTLGYYLTPAVLGSPRQTLMAPLIVTQVRQILNWGRGGAMALVLLSLTLVILGIGSLVARRLTRNLYSTESRS